jgi:MFS family permease
VTVSFPIFNIVGIFGFGWFADVCDQRRTMILTLALMGLGLLGLCYARQTGTLLIFTFLFSMGWGGSIILTRTMQRSYFGMASFGKMLGIIMGLGSLGGVIGPTLAGWIFDTTRSYDIMWLIFFGLCLLSIGLILTMKPAGERSPGT